MKHLIIILIFIPLLSKAQKSDRFHDFLKIHKEYRKNVDSAAYFDSLLTKSGYKDDRLRNMREHHKHIAMEIEWHIYDSISRIPAKKP